LRVFAFLCHGITGRVVADAYTGGAPTTNQIARRAERRPL
jgi:bacterioferritin-associated ferredoxin